MKSVLLAGAGLAATLFAAPAEAQAPATYWTCSYIVPTAQGAGVRMILAGPAGERTLAQTVYLASFRTADDIPTAFVKSAQYKAAFGDYLAGAGYATISPTGEAASSGCAFATTAAEAGARRAELASSGRGRGLRIAVTPVSVDWKPEAAPEPARKPTAGPAQASLSLFGAAFEDISAQTAAFLGLDPPKGAAVMSLEPGGQAAAAGLKRMDVVIEVAGQPIAKAGDIAAIVGRMRPGFQAPLRVWRDQKAVDLSLEVPPGLAPAAPAQARPRLGIAMRDNAADETATEGAPAAGAYVAEVMPGSPAEAGGLHPGDIVVKVAGAEMAGAAEMRAAVAQAPAGPLAIRVWRGGAFRDLTVQLDAP